MLLTHLTAAFRSRSAILVSAGLGAVLASSAISGCAVSEVGPEPVAEVSPVRLPAFRLSSRPATTINSLTDQQVDDTITVSGKIAQRAAVLEGWLYQVQDETGSLWVLTDREAPEVGESVTVEGAVRYEPIVIGDINASDFYLEEEAYQETQDRQTDG